MPLNTKDSNRHFKSQNILKSFQKQYMMFQHPLHIVLLIANYRWLFVKVWWMFITLTAIYLNESSNKFTCFLGIIDGCIQIWGLVGVSVLLLLWCNTLSYLLMMQQYVAFHGKKSNILLLLITYSKHCPECIVQVDTHPWLAKQSDLSLLINYELSCD